MIDTTWFVDRIADRRLSQRRLAKLIGIDAGAMSLMLRGKRRMTLKEAMEIARLLGVDVAEVLMRAGADVRVPASRVESARGPVDEGAVVIPVTMSDGSTARLMLPRVVTATDAERISAIVRAFAL